MPGWLIMIIPVASSRHGARRVGTAIAEYSVTLATEVWGPFETMKSVCGGLSSIWSVGDLTEV